MAVLISFFVVLLPSLLNFFFIKEFQWVFNMGDLNKFIERNKIFIFLINFLYYSVEFFLFNLIVDWNNNFGKFGSWEVSGFSEIYLVKEVFDQYFM
jgi:hypothetical protein